jgi:hypothetical protein
MASDDPVRKRRPIGLWLAGAVVLAAVAVLGLSAWRGWGEVSLADEQRQAEEDAKQKQAEDEQKEKELDPQVERLVVQPGEPQSDAQAMKPGHWVSGTQRMRAVYQDFVGQQRTQVVNGQGTAYPVPGTPIALESTRPVTLAKGQPKEIASTFLAPQTRRRMLVRGELVERGFGRTQRSQTAIARMPSYQYFFVVLAREPSRYTLIKTLDSVSVPWGGETDLDDTDDPLHYRVVLLPVERSIPLADNALIWTSTAYLLWDEVDPKLFTPEQQRALVDWLHWGGQLIVNGPDSLDSLKGSFLAKYLPATSGGGREIGAGDLRDLNQHWRIRTGGAGGRLAPQAPWSGVELVSQLGADEVDPLGETTGGLLMERAVGRGRVVVSAMQLAERDLVNWRDGFESLFNGGILRRPQREYRPGYYGELTLAWADAKLAERRLDARLTTGLRTFSRDLGVDANYQLVDAEENTTLYQAPGQPTRQEWRPPAATGGIGAWNGFSTTANTARESLLEAAGVEVPDTSFVVIALVLYLVALVPLNWLVFNAIGRVEWAWIAAPVIALAGTWLIVDRARLDIGFVRAQTEIGVLELQPGYDRGMVSRYTALYTSLSTTYDLEFENLTVLAAPFSTSSKPDDSSESTGAVATFERFDAVRLRGVFVPSNTTNMVHSEQMFPLDGAIQLGRSQSQGRLQIENRSKFLLRSTALVERTSRDEESGGREPGLRGTWIGELRPGESLPAFFGQPIVLSKDEWPYEQERADEAKLVSKSRLDLEPMFRLALDVDSFEPGEKRLVARIDEVLPGESIAPAASQVQGSVLVVAHLDYGPLSVPLPDVNTRRDVAKHEESGFGSQDLGKTRSTAQALTPISLTPGS